MDHPILRPIQKGIWYQNSHRGRISQDYDIQISIFFFDIFPWQIQQKRYIRSPTEALLVSFIQNSSNFRDRYTIVYVWSSSGNFIFITQEQMRLASAVKLKKQLQQYQKAKNPQRKSSSNQIDHKTFHHQNEILQNQERPNYHTPTLPSCKNKQITDEHPELSGSPPNDVGVSFNHIRQSLSSFREPRKRFAHECPCALLLYSLVFNHFHLEGIQSKLPEIQRIDRQIIKALKTVLEGKVNENEPGEEISDGKAGLLLCLIEDISLTVKQKQLSLKAIISKISSETIKTILTSMEHLRMRESTHQQAGLGLWSKGNEPSEREGAAWKKVIDCFGKAFALQVSVTDIEGKTRLGASQSYVKVSMRRPQGEWRFFLRKVSCFELDQQQQQK